MTMKPSHRPATSAELGAIVFGRLFSRIVAGRINRGAGAPAAEAAAAEGVPAAIAVLQHSTPKSALWDSG